MFKTKILQNYIPMIASLSSDSEPVSNLHKNKRKRKSVFYSLLGFMLTPKILPLQCENTGPNFKSSGKLDIFIYKYVLLKQQNTTLWLKSPCQIDKTVHKTRWQWHSIVNTYFFRCMPGKIFLNFLRIIKTSLENV